MKFLISLLFLSLIGACDMTSNANSTNSAMGQSQQNVSSSADEKRILVHLKENFSLNADEVIVTKLDTELFPPGTSSYYAEKTSSYGNIAYRYFIYQDKLFCSGIENDFEAYLKEAKFLENKNLTAAQFLGIYKTLKSNYKKFSVINEKILEKPSKDLEPILNKISAPKLDYSNSGAKMTFFIKRVAGSLVRKINVNINSDYTSDISFENMTDK